MNSFTRQPRTCLSAALVGVVAVTGVAMAGPALASDAVSSTCDAEERASFTRPSLSDAALGFPLAIVVELLSTLRFSGCVHPESTRLLLDVVDKRIQLHALKRGVPSTSEGLAAVFGAAQPPVDGWGREFIYVAPGPNGRAYDLISLGRDGKPGGQADNSDLKLSDM